MFRRLVIHSLAKKETRKAYLWYKKRSVRAAGRFQHAISQALIYIQEMPSIHQQMKYGIRFYALKEYPYIIVFWFDDFVLKVIGVSHNKRKPEYWVQRIKLFP
jgi:toxin ParE1/3/4